MVFKPENAEVRPERRLQATVYLPQPTASISSRARFKRSKRWPAAFLLLIKVGSSSKSRPSSLLCKSGRSQGKPHNQPAQTSVPLQVHKCPKMVISGVYGFQIAAFRMLSRTKLQINARHQLAKTNCKSSLSTMSTVESPHPSRTHTLPEGKPAKAQRTVARMAEREIAHIPPADVGVEAVEEGALGLAHLTVGHGLGDGVLQVVADHVDVRRHVGA